MAKPIKETPVLIRKDTSAFVKNINEGDRNSVRAQENLIFIFVTRIKLGVKSDVTVPL